MKNARETIAGQRCRIKRKSGENVVLFRESASTRATLWWKRDYCMAATGATYLEEYQHGLFFSFMRERALQAGRRALSWRKLSVMGVISVSKNDAMQWNCPICGEDLSLTTVCVLLLGTKKRPAALDKLIIHQKWDRSCWRAKPAHFVGHLPAR